MRRSFKAVTIPVGWSRSPATLARLGLGGLLAANLLAAVFVFHPFGGSVEDLETRAVTLQNQIQQRKGALARTRLLMAKINRAREGGGDFYQTYFVTRQAAYSTLLTELTKAAADSGIRPKGETYNDEPVEGSDSLFMVTVDANFEGTYGDLLRFVNRLDKSDRFLILERLTAAPVANSSNLNVSVKLHTFVREAGPTSAPARIASR